MNVMNSSSVQHQEITQESTAASSSPIDPLPLRGGERVDFLTSVNERLDELLRVDPAADDEQTERLIVAARRLCLAGGKRARPWLVMMVGEALGVDLASRRDLSVCVELIHTASLLHDDVVDEGERRRGHPTANVVWGNLSAVLSGDLVMTIALGELRRHPAELIHAALDTVAAMSRAAVREAAARGRVEIGVERWRQIAEGKTGSLFGLCGRGAGILADDEEAAARFFEAGAHWGVAFQIADDLDDLAGRAVGKPALVDLRNGNPSYLLLAAAEESDDVRRRLDEIWTGPEASEAELHRMRAEIIESGGVYRAWQAIGEEIGAAEEALAPWRHRPSVTAVCDWARGMWQRAEPGKVSL
jgi:geranylgeranyl pyrophosphate synthase